MMIGWVLALVLIVLLFSSQGKARSGRGLITAFVVGLIAVYGAAGLWMGGMHGWGWGGWSGGWAWPRVLASLALLGGTGAVLWLLLGRLPAGDTEAEAALKLRLAKGEITPEEYDLLLKKTREN